MLEFLMLMLAVLIICFSNILVEEVSKSERLAVVLGLSLFWIGLCVLVAVLVSEESYNLKQECEKDLLRSDQCVMIFVTQKKGE